MSNDKLVTTATESSAINSQETNEDNQHAERLVAALSKNPNVLLQILAPMLSNAQ